VEQKILTRCPPERFCALPTGEICVYGIAEIPQMTQVTLEELARVLCPPAQQPMAMLSTAVSGLETALLGAALIVGIIAGRFWRGRERRHTP
jgi:hypothetical protein